MNSHRSNNTRKITIIGKYNSPYGTADGQVVKTEILTREIENRLGKSNIGRIDTYGWKKHPFKLLFKSILAVWKSHHVIFMTDEGGIKIFPWLLLCSNVFHKRKLHYVVVGGWLVHFVKKHSFIRACLKKFNGIYVETTVMLHALKKEGFKNIILLPNFKPLQLIELSNSLCHHEQPFRLCTFSRVMKEKGIDDAIDAVQQVNRYFNKTVCTLDIYGSVDPNQTEWFECLKETFSTEIRYCGVVDYIKSAEVLKDYFVLLFPTEFFTEGIPGTIIDAYAAGVPVVASQWESFSDVVDHDITGIGYSFGNQKCLKDVLIDLVSNPHRVYDMKINCLKKAEQYLPINVLEPFFQILDNA